MAKADPSPLPQTVPQAPAAGVASDLFKQGMEFALEFAKKEAAKPENQAAIKGVISVALPKLLGALGVSVPGVGIVMAVAGWVLPLLMSHIVSPDVGQALMVSGGGLVGIPVVSKILGILDRFKAPQ